MADLRARIFAAVPVDDWVRTQWVARVAFDLGTGPIPPEALRTTFAVLREAHHDAQVLARNAWEERSDELGGIEGRWAIPRTEWKRPDPDQRLVRLAHSGIVVDGGPAERAAAREADRG